MSGICTLIIKPKGSFDITEKYLKCTNAIVDIYHRSLTAKSLEYARIYYMYVKHHESKINYILIMAADPETCFFVYKNMKKLRDARCPQYLFGITAFVNESKKLKIVKLAEDIQNSLDMNEPYCSDLQFFGIVTKKQTKSDKIDDIFNLQSFVCIKKSLMHYILLHSLYDWKHFIDKQNSTMNSDRSLESLGKRLDHLQVIKESVAEGEIKASTPAQDKPETSNILFNFPKNSENVIDQKTASSDASEHLQDHLTTQQFTRKLQFGSSALLSSRKYGSEPDLQSFQMPDSDSSVYLRCIYYRKAPSQYSAATLNPRMTSVPGPSSDVTTQNKETADIQKKRSSLVHQSSIDVQLEQIPKIEENESGSLTATDSTLYTSASSLCSTSFTETDGEVTEVDRNTLIKNPSLLKQGETLGSRRKNVHTPNQKIQNQKALHKGNIASAKGGVSKTSSVGGKISQRSRTTMVPKRTDKSNVNKMVKGKGSAKASAKPIKKVKKK